MDPFVPFILETWTRYPKLPASRIYRMCCERGFTGRPDYFRQRVARYRPRPRAEAYLRLKTRPGEQGQVDWGHFGHVTIGRARRPLVAFVCVLSWSRALSFRFYLGQQTENFLRGHQHAFRIWGGAPRVLLYDNLKSAVLERVGDAIRFNPLLLAFAGHHRFEPRPVARARGNEKGRVERAISYMRRSFFLGRAWRDLADLNAQADAWCGDEAMQRPWPEDRTRRVGEVFAEEREQLLALPDDPFPTHERVERTVRKTPYLRFDCNDYSVPHLLVGRSVEVVAAPERVRVLLGSHVLAEHPRSYDKGQQIENPDHVAGLYAAKRAARRGRGRNRLVTAAPSAEPFYARLAEAGYNLGNATQRLLLLLDTYGGEALDRALAEVLAHGRHHVPAVRRVLERNHHAKGLPPATPLPLPDDPRVRGLAVRPHSLAGYDQLAEPPSPDPGGLDVEACPESPPDQS